MQSSEASQLANTPSHFEEFMECDNSQAQLLLFEFQLRVLFFMVGAHPRNENLFSYLRLNSSLLGL